MTTDHEVRRAREFRAQGFWTDQVLEDLFQASVAATPEKKAVVAHRADRPLPMVLTFRALDERVARVAGSLRALGVDRGDVVSVQLPNWWEFIAVALACGRIGAVFCPLMPILRERELLFMLGLTETKVYVVPSSFRGHDFATMARAMRPELPKLRHVVVVDEDGPDGFVRRLQEGGPAVPSSAASSAGLRPDDLTVVMFTSGTTGEPKGVMHSSNSIVAAAHSIAERLGLTRYDVILVAAPLPHMLGYAASWLLALRLGATTVLQDIWEAKRGLALMQEEGVSHTAGSTPFLNDLCEVSSATGMRPRSFRTFMCSGAPIPPSLVERASAELNVKVSSAWGMTEVIAGTMTEPARALEKSSKADGRAMNGMEVRVVDLGGKPVPTGVPGRLLVRGAQRAMGYYKRPTLMLLDADGWLDSGDLGQLDAEGYVRITGRTKDVLIRGGENIPVVEIENLLYKHPSVAAAAIVGYPDRRLGERACAFIVPRPGASIDLAEIHRYMAEAKTAKQYWPERVEIVHALPLTPTGKVQKFVLRDLAKRFGDVR
jgi:cyclohexanecarboxylate-CoA ligase